MTQRRFEVVPADVELHSIRAHIVPTLRSGVRIRIPRRRTGREDEGVYDPLDVRRHGSGERPSGPDDRELRLPFNYGYGRRGNVLGRSAANPLRTAPVPFRSQDRLRLQQAVQRRKSGTRRNAVYLPFAREQGTLRRGSEGMIRTVQEGFFIFAHQEQPEDDVRRMHGDGPVEQGRIRFRPVEMLSVPARRLRTELHRNADIEGGIQVLGAVERLLRRRVRDS